MTEYERAMEEESELRDKEYWEREEAEYYHSMLLRNQRKEETK